MIATIYNKQTGIIRTVIRANLFADVEVNIAEGESFIEGDYDPEETFVDETGQPVPFPTPRPGPWATWDRATGSWTDPRTPDDHAAALIEARNKAAMDKTDFIMRALQFQLITADEAREISKSLIPARFQAVFQQIPEEYRLEVEIRWSAAKLIERQNPAIILIADALGLSEEQLDLLFDVSIE